MTMLEPTRATHPTVCAPWCTRKHPPGADPRRLNHLHVWKSRGKVCGLKVEMYPYGTTDEAFAFFNVVGKFGEARSLLTIQDLRSLADHILQIAHAAEQEQRAATGRSEHTG